MIVLAEKPQKNAIILVKSGLEASLESMGISLKTVKPDLISNITEVMKHLSADGMRKYSAEVDAIARKYVEENHMAIVQALTATGSASGGEWDVTRRITLLLQAYHPPPPDVPPPPPGVGQLHLPVTSLAVHSSTVLCGLATGSKIHTLISWITM